MQRTLLLSDDRDLTFGYKTTHRDRRDFSPEDLYVSRLWYNRSDGYAYTIMAYQRQQRPSALQSFWGIYRVDEWPGNFYYPEGNYTLLKGEMTQREARQHLVDVVSDDPGHQHAYWTDESIIQRYREGIGRGLTGFCKTCSHWIYTEQVETLIEQNAIEILPADWYLNLSSK